MRLTRALWAGALVALAGAVLAPSALAGGNTDASIARTVHFIGGGVFNTTGEDQTVTQSKTPVGTTRYFAIKIFNADGDGNYWNVTGCSSTKKFKVKYFMEFVDESFQDVTSTVTGSGQTTAQTNGGDSRYLEMQIKPTSKAKPGSSFGCLVTADPVPDSLAPADAVKGVVEVKG